MKQANVEIDWYIFISSTLIASHACNHAVILKISVPSLYGGNTTDEHVEGIVCVKHADPHYLLIHTKLWSTSGNYLVLT